MRLLLVEDNQLLREILKLKLTGLGYLVDAYESAEDMMDDVIEGRSVTWSLALLDVNLPGENGIDLARRLRATFPQLGIVILTVNQQLLDKLNAYEAGADVYLSKPVDAEELHLVLLALYRRLQPALQQQQAFQLHLDSRLLFSPQQQTVRLTSNELKVLQALLLSPEQFIETWQLRLLLNKDGDEHTAAFDVLMSRLRKKLTEMSGDPHAIETIRTKGYQLQLSMVLM